jgi:GntR family transcriptional regulator/MocR family aminotransferase
MWQRLYDRAGSGARTRQAQLRDAMVLAVTEGYLAPGEALPSSRWLAETLSVSRTTATLALQDLQDKGLAESRSRSGCYVSRSLIAQTVPEPVDRALPAGGQARPPDWNDRLKMRPSAQRNIRKPADWQRLPYPFIYGQFDASLFPAADWRECVLETLQTQAFRRWAPDHIDRDDAGLVEQIVRRLLPARGISADESQVLVTSGAQQGTYLLAQLLLGPGTVVGIENPGFPDARNNFLLRTRLVRPLPVDEQGLVCGSELTGCRYVFTTPSHQCPTTVTMPVERRSELLARAQRDDFVLIEDDHESELNFSGHPSPALKSMDSAERVIYLGSLSKTLVHGLRLGYIVAPREVIVELRALRRLVMRHVSTNNQQAAAAFIARGHHEAYVRRLNGVYRQRASVLRDALQRHALGLTAVNSQGGSALWTTAPHGVDTRELAQSLYPQGVVVEPGDVFFAGDEPPRHCLRIGFSSIDVNLIEPGVRVIAAALAQRSGVSRGWAAGTG